MRRLRPLWCVCQHCGIEFEPLKWKGYVQKFCSTSCANRARNVGYLDKHGYRLISSGYRNRASRPEHHLVMEQMIGRRLLKGETVHHKNGVRHDNRPENLELWSSRHGKGQRVSDRIRDALTFLAEHQPHSVDFSNAVMSLGA